MRVAGKRSAWVLLVVVLWMVATGSARAQIVGACCHADGTCTATLPEACPASPTNIWQGGCVTCDIAICTVACCFLDGSCVTTSSAACLAVSGGSQGVGSFCSPLPSCPFALGTCCFANGSCTLVKRNQCGGVFQGTGVTCNDFCPPPRGACCRGGQCVFLLEADCNEHHWAGAGTSCAPFEHACCPADVNVSGVVSVQDIFDFLERYFAGSMGADFNRNCFLSVQDIFDFLTAYFIGCP